MTAILINPKLNFDFLENNYILNLKKILIFEDEIYKLDDDNKKIFLANLNIIMKYYKFNLIKNKKNILIYSNNKLQIEYNYSNKIINFTELYFNSIILIDYYPNKSILEKKDELNIIFIDKIYFNHDFFFNLKNKLIYYSYINLNKKKLGHFKNYDNFFNYYNMINE